MVEETKKAPIVTHEVVSGDESQRSSQIVITQAQQTDPESTQSQQQQQSSHKPPRSGTEKVFPTLKFFQGLTNPTSRLYGKRSGRRSKGGGGGGGRDGSHTLRSSTSSSSSAWKKPAAGLRSRLRTGSEDGTHQRPKCVILTNFGGYDRFRVKRFDRPVYAAEGHIIVEVKACGMNFSDIYTRQGLYTFSGKRPPFVMGLECAGIVYTVGHDVENFKPGDHVVCWSSSYGMWSEVVHVSVQNCHQVPPTMSFEEAAAIPISYLTAYICLFDFGNLRPNQSVLIQAAGGGLGCAATQLAKTVSNVCVYGTASKNKLEDIRNNGVDVAIDYRHDDFQVEIQRKTDNAGVDVIMDCLSGHDFNKAQRILKPLGKLIHIGISNMVQGEKRSLCRALKVWWATKNIGVLSLILHNRAICGFNLATLMEREQDVIQRSMDAIIQLYIEGKIKPKIDSVYPFEEVVTATKRMTERKNIGKIILVPHKS